MQIINGKEISDRLKGEMAAEVERLRSERGRAPHLAAVLVGNDPASETYVKNKEKSCQEVGISSSVYRLPENTTEAQLLEVIDFVNRDEEIDGLIVQLPLPKGLDADKVVARIAPEKDVDGFHPLNVGRMVLGQPAYLPATPMGILLLLERSGIETEGRHCVVVGRSNIVGTPVSLLLSRNKKGANCTVTLCHSRTKNLAEICRTADILVVAIGKCEAITAEYVKEGAVVIDVGIHRVEDATKKSGYALKGDVKYDEVAPHCACITPVPGGVGPMTIVGLLRNTISAFKGEIYPNRQVSMGSMD
ncbi:MAG: bifunctional methylenetetrahydrofolate dehydrogenase/methenyltetrahydrofolate cyclohydrolase FolD [Bacteroidales bacterium]|nr:bifunctional methylenetetrahydrofolate dehydrogenase/methenyltetrahydrofolate cyclohydrolase FolD [Bacteroidales bacterium]